MEAVINSKVNAKQSNILSNESSVSSSVSVRSKKSGKGSKKHHTAQLRKILKKIKKQQKQSKKIEKIFLSEKQNRDNSEKVIDPYVVRNEDHYMTSHKINKMNDCEEDENSYHIFNKV